MHIRQSLRRMRDSIRRRLARIHPAPTFLLGSQKSGTTAIAALLGKRTGLETTLDLQNEFLYEQNYHKVCSGHLSLEAFIRLNKVEFAKPLIKDPNLTLLYPQLKERFPESQFVFVVRHPLDTIRSILDRLDIPGNLSALPSDRLNALPFAWRHVFETHGTDQSNYVARLASRWNAMAELYRQHQDQTILIRYEDFCVSKEATITQLAESLGLPCRFSISDQVDVQYQRSGSNRTTDTAIFFGANAQQIEQICGPYLSEFDYVRAAA